MCPDLLVFANVFVLRRCSCHQRPQLPDLLFADVEEASSNRREQPLMETGAVIIRAELVSRKREMAERVRSINENFNPARTSEFHELADRHDLPREVRDVRQLDDFRFRSYSGCELVDDVLL